MRFTAQSLELNPIVHLWERMKEKICFRLEH